MDLRILIISTCSRFCVLKKQGHLSKGSLLLTNKKPVKTTVSLFYTSCILLKVRNRCFRCSWIANLWLNHLVIRTIELEEWKYYGKILDRVDLVISVTSYKIDSWYPFHFSSCFLWLIRIGYDISCSAKNL